VQTEGVAFFVAKGGSFIEPRIIHQAEAGELCFDGRDAHGKTPYVLRFWRTQEKADPSTTRFSVRFAQDDKTLIFDSSLKL
jgi:hypothetical protein